MADFPPACGTPEVALAPRIACFWRHTMSKELLISTGVVKNASGSAYVELGNMKILCSVQGPRDSFLADGFNDKGKLFCDFKYAPFCMKDTYKEMNQVVFPQLCLAV